MAFRINPKFKVILIFLFVALLYYLITYDTSKDKDDLNKSYAPAIQKLFDNTNDDPHLYYTSDEACLVCHLKGAKLPDIKKAPQINHIIKERCNYCHIKK